MECNLHRTIVRRMRLILCKSAGCQSFDRRRNGRL
jgi:hypothetical protein